ncbi:nitroreductase family protein [Akkermansia sp.]|uniref:nitroreductase family protein n=1 Tax=Akkermansia sp. TaxID=1872421 RepID=UPI003AB33A89
MRNPPGMRLREVSWNQSQVEDCSHYVVLCARRTATQRDVDRYLAQIEFTRHPSAEKLASSADFYTGYVKSLTPEKMHTWLDCQVYIAAGFLLSAAAALRVDSCTIGGMDRDKYDEILGLDGTPYRSVVSVALGYRAKDDDYAREAKVRFPAGEVIDIRA